MNLYKVTDSDGEENFVTARDYGHIDRAKSESGAYYDGSVVSVELLESDIYMVSYDD